MGHPSLFDNSKITDQKRLVRGEQYLLARSILRARDVVHSRKWRVLMMAGGAPAGEVNALRELMPLVHITAVDKNQSCLDAAIEAGVDEIIHCDLANFSVLKTGFSLLRKPAVPLRDAEKFDIVSLDLCGGATILMRDIAKMYASLVTTRGVYIFTFSYGRDVTEAFSETIRELIGRKEDDEKYGVSETTVPWVQITERLLGCGAPDVLLGRLAFLFKGKHLLGSVRSIMVYKGAEMPMCSVLFHFKRAIASTPISFIKVEPGDFELAVAYPEASNLYDCPKARVEGLRRSFAALKAAITRKNRTLFDSESA